MGTKEIVVNFKLLQIIQINILVVLYNINKMNDEVDLILFIYFSTKCMKL